MKLVRDNGLTIVLVLASLLTIGGMFATGWVVHNDELVQSLTAPVSVYPRDACWRRGPVPDRS